MEKRKRTTKLTIFLAIFVLILLIRNNVFAINLSGYLSGVEYSDEYLKWSNLTDEQKSSSNMPRMYNIRKDNVQYSNPLKMAKALGGATGSKFDLRNYIKDNIVVKNQKQLGSCWAFASIGALETNLAMNDYKNNNQLKLYDFSERHLEYATSQTFLNNIKNPIGFSRNVGDGGIYQEAIAYLTNGSGAIEEYKMPYTDSKEKIDISEIQNKEAITQIYDTVEIPSPSMASTEEIKQIMKEHITQYGGIYANIHEDEEANGNETEDGACPYSETGALYCNDASVHVPNHAILIIGWDDNYSVNNFKEGYRPKNNGAWIAKDSHGTNAEWTYTYTYSQIKEILFEAQKDYFQSININSPSQIPDSLMKEIAESAGLKIEGDKVIYYAKHNDDGFLYISYEDANVYNSLMGIVKADDSINYENIYQYDEYGTVMAGMLTTNKCYLANVFSKKTSSTEYLSQVAITTPETTTCKVYVNLNGTSKQKEDLQPVELKTGESATFDAGYHTLEFLDPLEIKGNEFVVVIEIQGQRTDAISFSVECNYPEYYKKVTGSELPQIAAYNAYGNVKIEDQKCFITESEGFNANSWIDLSEGYSISSGNLPDSDLTIKAFTISKQENKSLESIEIKTPPTNTKYIEGENFDKTGMEVIAKYDDGSSNEIVNYNIINGTDLKAGQTSVTISYENKTVNQQITVIEGKTVTKIEVITPPTKINYIEGEDFNKNGMIVVATFEDGETMEITDYEILDGINLKESQESVTISYRGKTTTQNITVEKNTELEEKEILSIEIAQKPTKIQYIQNKEKLDLEGGKIKINYDDYTSKEIPMTSIEVSATGFSNEKLGKITIEVTYKSHTASFEIEIIEDHNIVEMPENTDFTNAKGNVRKIKHYTFTDISEPEYMLIEIIIDGISRSTKNDKFEYYYYLSANKDEKNIENWIEIKENQLSNSELEFEINTNEISNFKELSDADTLYLYINEVAILGGNQTSKVSKAMELNNNVTIEKYIDNAKVSESNSNQIIDNNLQDDTIAPGKLPFAGLKGILIIVCVVLILGIVIFIRYKNISQYIK